MMSALDRFLRWKDGVFEFSQDPDSLLRVRLSHAVRPLTLPNGHIPAGARVLELHLWNERLPPLPANGPDMAWAAKTHRLTVVSCRLLARHLLEDARLAGVQGLTGATILFFPGDRSGAEKLFTRLGFTAAPYQSSLGRFGEFWENVHTWMIMRACNATTLQPWQVHRLRRTAFWMSASEFVRRHSERAAAPVANVSKDHTSKR